MNRNALIATLLACLVAACGQGSTNEANQSGNTKTTALTTPTATSTKRTTRGHIGVLVAKESVNVPSQAGGIVRSVLVDIGDSVAAGQSIATMDTQSMKSALAIASANARASSARAKRLRVQMEAAEVVAKRHVAMGAGIVAKQEIEAANTRAASSAAAYAEASAETSAQQTRVSQLKRQLAETTIKAPFAGKIAQRLVTPGEAVSAGAPIVLLITAESLRVDFVVPLGEQTQYKIGDKIEVELDAGEAVFSGIVRRIAPNLDSVTQMTTMQAELVGQDERAKTLQAGVGVWVRPLLPSAP
jgi:RND family efflux transporter MFP subunit